MKFLLDENIGKVVAQSLEKLGHSIFRVKLINPGIEDYLVLELALSKKAVLITSDGDFGRLVFKEGKNHSGAIFLRLQDQSSENKIKAIRYALSKYKNINEKSLFLVVIEKEGVFGIRVKRS